MGKHKAYSIQFKSQVLEYRKTHSGVETAKKFKIDERHIRYWKNQQQSIEQSLQTRGSAMRVAGGGCKPICLELEEYLLNYILEQRAKNVRLSRNGIISTALEAFPLFGDSNKNFKASVGWFKRFMKRNGLSLSRNTTLTDTTRKDPSELHEKIVSYIRFVTGLSRKYKFKPEQIIAMDETSVVFDLDSDTTGAEGGSQGCNSAGSEKLHFTLILSAKGDGEKLKPYIVFKTGSREAKKLQNEIGDAVINSSNNGWMNDNLTKDWLSKVLKKNSSGTRLLVWDSYRCHIRESTKALLQGFDTKVAVVPVGCTNFLQPSNVTWNTPFKESMTTYYENWMSGDQDKEYTSGGYLKAPSKKLVTTWIVKAWESVSQELIFQSFKYCALTTDPFGSEDELIHCLKEGEPSRPAWNMLQNFRISVYDNMDESIDVEDQIVVEDYEERESNEILIDDDIEDNDSSESD